jgi:WhiB family transcriptional regulator, redox-sensing transcriptional regulator
MQHAKQYDDGYPGSRAQISSWYAQAACRGADPEVFFPQAKRRPFDPLVVAAKGICGRCPVRADCLSWVLDHPQDEGIWAGLDPLERRSLTRRSRRRRTGSSAVASGGSPDRNETAC